MSELLTLGSHVTIAPVLAGIDCERNGLVLVAVAVVVVPTTIAWVVVAATVTLNAKLVMLDVALNGFWMTHGMFENATSVDFCPSCTIFVVFVPRPSARRATR